MAVQGNQSSADQHAEASSANRDLSPVQKETAFWSLVAVNYSANSPKCPLKMLMNFAE